MTPSTDAPHSCTRSEDELWASLGSPPDAHELQCLTCQEQRRRLAPLAQAAQEWKTGTDPEESLLEGILGRDMHGIRTEIRRGTLFTLTVTPLGPLRISSYLLLEAIRDAVDSIEHMELRTHKIIPHADDAGPISLAVSLAMQAGQDGTEVAEETRRTIAARFAERIGMPIGTINVTVEDVFQ